MKLVSTFVLLAVTVCNLLFAQRSAATAYTATNNGLANWSSATTWSPNGVPGPNDTAEIRSGAQVFVDVDSACAGLIIDSGGKLANTATAGQTTLSLYGSLVNSNSSSLGFAAGGSSATKLTFASGNVSWTGSGDNSAGKFYVIVNSGVTLDISGLTTGIKFKSGSGTTQFTVNGTLIAGTQVISANGNANNTFVLGSGATIKTANPNGIFVSGSSTPMLNYVTAPTLNAAANFVFNGGAAQVTAGLPSAVNNLTISNASGVTLSAACTVNGALAMSGGVLKTTAANLLTLGSAVSVSGAASNAFVSGPLAQIYSVAGPKTFPIGTNGNYRAVTLNLTTLGTSPSTISVTPHEPSSLGASALGVPLFTNRNWTVASSASSGNVATLTVDGTGFVPVNSAVMVAYNGSGTNSYPATASSPNFTVAGIPLTAASDFALGDCTPPSAAPTGVTVSAPGCSAVSVSWTPASGAASYNVYRKFAGGSYAAPIGNSATTNYSDPTASGGSNYVYAVAAASVCGGESAKSADSSVVTPSSPAYFLASPASVTTGYNYTPTFSVSVINSFSNQWQISTNGGGVWKNVASGSGGTTMSYTTAFTTTNMTGNQFHCVAYGCSGAVTSAPATLTIQNFDQYDALRTVWRNTLIGIATNASSLSSINSKASGYQGTMIYGGTNTSPTTGYLWSDLPLGAQNDIGSGNIVASFKRLQDMALAYATPGVALYQNAGLLTTITNGLDWMMANFYTPTTVLYGNWFDWEVSGPKALDNAEIYLLANPTALTAAQITNYCRAFYNFCPDSENQKDYFWWGALTGANTADCVLNMALQGAIMGTNTATVTRFVHTSNSTSNVVISGNSLLSEARSNLSGVNPGDFSGDSVFDYVTFGDGFYDDGSFVFHGNIAYNGQYGKTLLADVADIVSFLNGSTWAITDPSLANVYDWATIGFEPFYYNGAFMDMVRGRSASWSSATEYDIGTEVIGTFRKIATFAPPATAAALLSFANAPQLPPGQFHFGAMDREVAHRSGFSFGLSMSSSRIANYENLFATSNLKGWYLGDGMTYLYLGGADTQFTGDYWPTMDYYHLPGTTAVTNTTPQPSTTDQDWVGGAQVANTFGVAGMSQHADSTTLFAKKSWFMLDNEIVCLGAGITCSDNGKTVDTTVENRRLGMAFTNHFRVNGTDIPPVIGWSSNLISATWCALDGVGGYYFPGGASNVRAMFVTNSGSWTQLNPSDKDLTVYTDAYLKLFFAHGIKPTNAAYAYVLLPNMNATSVSNYAAAPAIVVLSNTPTVQAVSKPSLGVVAANFWTTGTNSVGLITVNAKASVITLQNSNVLSVGISDPTHNNGGTITLTLNQSAASVVSADPEVSVVQLTPKIILSVDVGGTLGRAIQASFITNAPAATNGIPPIITTAGMIGSPGQFRIRFIGNSNFAQTVLSTTNLATPIANWTVLGLATQITNDMFEFLDSGATNNTQRFYQLRSP
jgi:hyaluronate lyase